MIILEVAPEYEMIMDSKWFEIESKEEAFLGRTDTYRFIGCKIVKTICDNQKIETCN